MSNTIRFCRGPIKPENLTDEDRAVYERHQFVWTAMGDASWSVDELLDQRKSVSQHNMYQALIELQEIGMVRTEEAVFLDEAVTRYGRALAGTFTYEDIKWRNGELVMRHGGPVHRWVIELFGDCIRSAMRGCANLVEQSVTFDNERFTMTFQRWEGESPMQLRRELLEQVKALVDAGGATAEQLQAILDHATNNEPTPGLATLPNQEDHEREHPHILYFGDKLRCQRCGVEQGIAFPTTDPNAAIKPFIAAHTRCLPLDAAPGDMLRALREEKRSQ